MRLCNDIFLRSYAPPSAEIAIARIRINQAAYLAEQMTATNALEKGGFSFKRKYTLTFNQFYQTKNERINKKVLFQKMYEQFHFFNNNYLNC